MEARAALVRKADAVDCELALLRVEREFVGRSVQRVAT